MVFHGLPGCFTRCFLPVRGLEGAREKKHGSKGRVEAVARAQKKTGNPCGAFYSSLGGLELPHRSKLHRWPCLGLKSAKYIPNRVSKFNQKHHACVCVIQSFLAYKPDCHLAEITKSQISLVFVGGLSRCGLRCGLMQTPHTAGLSGAAVVKHKIPTVSPPNLTNRVLPL